MNNEVIKPEYYKKSICVLYEDKEPFIGDTTLRENLFFFSIKNIKEALLKQFPECKIIFYPISNPDSFQFVKEVQTIFPRAEIFSYSINPDERVEKVSKDFGFRLHLYFPLSGSLLEYIYDTYGTIIEGLEKKLSLNPMENEKIYSFYKKIIEILNLDENIEEIFKKYGDLLRNILNVDVFLVYVFSPEKQQLHNIYASLDDFKNEDFVNFEFQEVILNDIFQKGELFIKKDFDYKVDFLKDKSSYQIKNIIALPFKSISHTSGLLVGLNKDKKNAFTPFDIQALRILGNPFFLIYDTLLYYERAKKLTITDDLTSLYNFRYLREFLGFEISRSLRYNNPLSVLFIDIDNFKSVNDTRGHLVGSAVLVEIGEIFKSMVRDKDAIVRYGGDEFVIILPETSIEGASVLAKRIKDKVENYVFKGGDDYSIKLTVSIGIATCPKHSSRAEDLIKMADTAMYEAKFDGKNKIKIANKHNLFHQE